MLPIEITKRGTRKKAAEAGLSYTENKIKDYEFKLKLRVRTSYFNLLLAKSDLKIMEDRRDLLEDLLKIAQNRPKNNPNYVYYFNKKNLQIVIKLEITGELQDKKIKIIDNTTSLMINISGNKVTNPIRLFSTRQSGPFNLQINFSKEKFNYQLSENDKYSEKYEDGIWCIIVNLAVIKDEEDIDF